MRFQDLLRSYGVEPGTFSAGAFRSPTRNLFAKVTAQFGREQSPRALAQLRPRHCPGRDRPAATLHVYSLSSNGKQTPETIHATRLSWTTGFSRYSNELLLARVDDRLHCLPNSDFPHVLVAADGGTMSAGTTMRCLGLETGYTIWELTDNFGMTAGSHRLTFGTHDELIDLVDDSAVFPAGEWGFDSLDSLEQGVASYYVRDLARGSERPGRVRGKANRLLRAGPVDTNAIPDVDRRAPPRRTLRPHPPHSECDNARRNSASTRRSTPSGNVLWSPRLGVNYDPTGDGTTVLRGGVGFFAGRPAYQWFRNVYRTNGGLNNRLFCPGEVVPEFTLDPSRAPSACAEPSPVGLPFGFPSNYFDPEFRFPKNLKLALGVDHLLPGGIVGSVDFLYTRGVNTFHVADVNLVGPLGTAVGEGGRAIYGPIEPATGEATPTRRSDSLGSVFQVRNGGGDRSYSIYCTTPQGLRQWDRVECGLHLHGR